MGDLWRRYATAGESRGQLNPRKRERFGEKGAQSLGLVCTYKKHFESLRGRHLSRRDSCGFSLTQVLSPGFSPRASGGRRVGGDGLLEQPDRLIQSCAASFPSLAHRRVGTALVSHADGG